MLPGSMPQYSPSDGTAGRPHHIMTVGSHGKEMLKIKTMYTCKDNLTPLLDSGKIKKKKNQNKGALGTCNASGEESSLWDSAQGTKCLETFR